MSSTASLLPREHGAYAELGFPILSGLLLARPGVATFAWAAAAVAGFLVHEPSAVLLGRRGERLRVALAGRARRYALASSVVTGTAGAAALALSPPSARLAAAVPVGLALMLLPFVMAGRQKTLIAELLVVAVFSAMVLPLGLSAGAPVGRVIAGSVVWFLSFGLGTLAVHAIKVRYKRAVSARRWSMATAGLGLTVCTCGILVLGWESVPLTAGLAVIPPALAASVLGMIWVHPRHLRTVGWLLTSANAMAAVLLVLLAVPPAVFATRLRLMTASRCARCCG